MPTPQELIKKVQEKVLQFEASDISLSETETRRALIDPLFAAIGWDIWDRVNPVSVRMEWRKNPNDRPVDYAFMVNGTPKLLVEAERLRDDITDSKWRNQLLLYSTQLGVKWCALTNGNVVRVYNSLAEEEAADKLLFEIEVKNIDGPEGLSINAFIEKFSMLSEESLRQGKLDEVWDKIYAKRKVFGYLKDKREDLIDDIVKNVKLTKKSVGEVLDQIVVIGEDLPVPPKHDPPPETGHRPLFDPEGRSIASYTGKKPVSFCFRGSIRGLSSWKDMLFEMSCIMRDTHAGNFDKILELTGFTRDGGQYPNCKEIPGTGIFVTTCLSAIQIIEYCGRLLVKFGYERQDIGVRVRGG